MSVIKLASGPKCDLYALVVNDICLAKEFIASLKEEDKKKAVALLNHVVQKGPPRNKEKFRCLESHIWELKPGGSRILCFFSKQGPKMGLVLTHGFPKENKKRKLQREIKKNYYNCTRKWDNYA